MSLPKTTNLWTVHGSAPGAGTGALKWKNDQDIPELHPSEVLVKLRAGSLNYRDIVSKSIYASSRFSLVGPADLSIKQFAKASIPAN